jgi:integrase
MAVIEERYSKLKGTTYRVKIRIKGFPPQTATFSRKTDAKRWAQQIETSIREGRHFKTAEAKKRTLEEAIDRYISTVLPNKPKSEKKQRAHLLFWKKRLGKYALSEITPPKIAEVRDELLSEVTYRKTKRSGSTVVRYLSALSHLFSIAEKEWMWVESNPVFKVSKPKESKGRIRFLTDQERTSLLQAAKEDLNPYIYLAILLAISTGMRASELLNLYWKDIDFSKDRITLHETKNNEIRAVPLVGIAKKELQKHFQTQNPKSLLVFPQLKRVQKVQKSATLRPAWLRILKVTGIKNLRWHDLRHEFCSQLAMSGATLAEIAEAAGHKSLSMVRRYSHLSEGHINNVVSRMNKKIFQSEA